MTSARADHRILNRRQMLRRFGTAAGLGVLLPHTIGCDGSDSCRDPDMGTGTDSGDGNADKLPDPGPGANDPSPWYETGWLSDPVLDQIFLFYLGSAWQQLSDIGECMSTARKVDPRDDWSWSREWAGLGARLAGVAQKSQAQGLQRSAAGSYLRAATYYRAALHRHPNHHHDSVQAYAKLAVTYADLAVELGDDPITRVAIPYEGTTLPGWMFWADTQAKAPLLVIHQGRDAWSDDCRYLANAAIARGYHCLIFEGPGQGQVLRLQGLAFRPDWENVVSPVLDWATAQPGVDASRIALLGISMGGALAPRAAAVDPRIKLLVSNPGVYRWSDIYTSFLPTIDPNLPHLLHEDPTQFNQIFKQVMDHDAFLRWAVADTMWKHGATTPADAFLALLTYTNEGFAERINCRSLIMDATTDEWSQGQMLYDAIPGPKDFLMLGPDEAAELHVQTGTSSVFQRYLFEWLDRYLP